MPYGIFEENGEYCVYKVDADDSPVGDALGCHEGEEQAEEQRRALYANEPDAGKALDPESLVYYGGAVKALGDGKVGGYLVRFGGVDLEGEFFTRNTDFGGADRSDTYYNHGLDRRLGPRVIGKGTLTPDDVGIWIDAQLEMRDEYERAIYQMAEAGKLGWSSGTAPHLVQREQKGEAVHITRWPLGLDASLTPTPAEPRNAALPLKSLKAETETDPEAAPQADSLKEPAADATAATVDVNININVEQQQEAAVEEPPATTEVIKMSEKDEATKKAEEVEQTTVPSIMVDAGALESIIEGAVTKAVATVDERWAERVKKMDPDNNPGWVVSGDRADRALAGNPFKSFGEFLIAIKNHARGIQGDERLLPLLSGDPMDEGGFSVTKAMGPAFVGSLTRTSLKSRGFYKAPTGLNETTPADGGFLVGTDSPGGLMARMYDVGQVLSRVDMVPVSGASNAMTFNAEDEQSRADGSRRGGIRGYWLAEAASFTGSQPKFRQMELKLRKVGALVYATDELLADAAALEAWIMNALPEELAFVVEDAVFNGDGVGKPQGILNSNSLVSVAKETGQAATTIVSENIDKMWARRWTRAQDYAWYVNQDVWPQLAGLNRAVGTGGALVYNPPNGLAGVPYATILGRPVFEVEYCQTLGTVGDILLASMGEYQMIEKGGVEAASSIHVAFLTGEQVFRFMYRVDGQSKWNEALTPKNGSNSVSPFVALASRA